MSSAEKVRIEKRGLTRYFRVIASKRNLEHFVRMYDKDSSNLLVRLALRAALCGAGLVTVYTAMANVMLRLGLAPK
jgi:hypothetical protein